MTMTTPSSAEARASPPFENGEEGRTTVLSPGVVESRNYDPSSKSRISAEIRAFVDGTDGNGASPGFRSECRTFFTVWMFVTRLPSPAWVDLHPGFLMRGMSYFPVVGSVLGGICAVVFDCLDASIGLSPRVAAALAVGVGLYATGCFHEDGLADSADGLGGGWSRGQALKIMTDSRVGTFGCAALGLFLFAKLSLLGDLGTSVWRVDLRNGGDCAGAGPAMLAAQAVSRLSAPYLIRTRDYVAEVGPKSPFYVFMVEAKHIVSWPRVLFAVAYCFAVSSMLYGRGFASVLIPAVLALAHLAGNKGDYLLGGVMGDFLGGTICVSEVLVLILIAARDHVTDTCREVHEIISRFDGLSSDVLRELGSLYSNDRVRPLLHLSVVVLLLRLWCTRVGPPDMYDREDAKKDAESKTKKGD